MEAMAALTFVVKNLAQCMKEGHGALSACDCAERLAQVDLLILLLSLRSSFDASAFGSKTAQETVLHTSKLQCVERAAYVAICSFCNGCYHLFSHDRARGRKIRSGLMFPSLVQGEFERFAQNCRSDRVEADLGAIRAVSYLFGNEPSHVQCLILSIPPVSRATAPSSSVLVQPRRCLAHDDDKRNLTLRSNKSSDRIVKCGPCGRVLYIRQVFYEDYVSS